MGSVRAASPTWRARYRWALEHLDAPHEARWLVEEAAGGRHPAVLDQAVGDHAGAHFEALVERRAAGEPLQYVLGHWPFRSLDLLVDPRVLIPRPETEQVVEVALTELAALRASASARVAGPVAVDLGTGSGAIALSLAAEAPVVGVWGLEVWATDCSPGALAVAGANLAGLGGRAASRVHLVEGPWWDALPSALRGRVDLAVSNPPYLSSDELTDLDPVVARWEPRDALEAGPGGLEDVADIVSGASQWLARPGTLVVEIAPHQSAVAVALARSAGCSWAEVRPDLAGRDRALVARWCAGAQ
ncbi:MAG: peptide chain release factor N(5)-glutamine methyltransferase [Acidimicrobiales bacterium]